MILKLILEIRNATMETSNDLLGTPLIQINNTEIFWPARRLLYVFWKEHVFLRKVGYLNE